MGARTNSNEFSTGISPFNLTRKYSTADCDVVKQGKNSVVPTGKWWYSVGEHSFHNKENLMYGIQTGSGVNNIDETEEEFPHDD